ncbi:MAG: DUF427 domain-containing protein [Cytophagales bacterium]|nr:DUF427 domain-containing protein [Cytophagales bacterium]
MKAFWKDQLLAESDDTIMIEGSHYFPLASINREFFQESDTNTFCVWRGIAHFLDINIAGEVIEDAAWYYLNNSQLVASAEGRIAFIKGIKIVE